jgi:hypothetical protein
MNDNSENEEFISETEEALRKSGVAWENFRDAIYEQIEPLMKKLAEILDKIT